MSYKAFTNLLLLISFFVMENFVWFDNVPPRSECCRESGSTVRDMNIVEVL